MEPRDNAASNFPPDESRPDESPPEDSPPDAENPPGMNGRDVALICTGLLILFAVVSWAAVAQKCSTYDEPVHALGSWLALRYGDFRIDPENPPLWQHWAALPHGREALKLDTGHPDWGEIVHRDQEARYTFAPDMLYRTPENDGEE